MAIIQFKPGFDTVIYFKIKEKGRNLKGVASYFEFNKRPFINLNLKPELIKKKKRRKNPADRKSLS